MVQELRRGSQGDQVAGLQAHLRRLGYFSGDRSAPASEGAVAAVFDYATEIALKRLQRFYGLPESGVYDIATQDLMSLPRCGNPDFAEFAVDGRRWDRKALTYAIENTPAGLSMIEVQSALNAALGLWSNVTPLRFTEVQIGTAHDIRIRFVGGDHGDGSALDGPSGVLAHAFYPPPNNGDLAGDVHFDMAETWTVAVPTPLGSIDLISVAAHEFGHSLGLKHSDVQGALMFPIYRGPHRFLAADDMDGIRSLYGTGFLVQTGTALHETDATFDFDIASNGDLFAIKKSGTGSNSTEVHVLSAASNYQQFVIQTGTALNETDARVVFAVADNRDLFAIMKSATGSHSTEVHVLSAASNYQQFIVQTGTALHETDEAFDFCLTSGRKLFAIKKHGTGSNSTEVHIVDAP